MAHEDDLLACLLDVAEAELNSLNRKENGNFQSSTENNKSQNKNVRLLQDIDLFSFNNNEDKSKNVEEKLFSIHAGDTDSSDDEANRNLEEKKYSDSGESIKQLLNHSKAFNSCDRKEMPTKSTPSKSWKTKRIGEQSKTTIKEKPAGLGGAPNVVSSDTMFGIRVINPIISSKNLEEKMTGRKVVPILRISNYLQSLSINDDWVIAGVICNKGTTKTSAKGSQFMIWTISDLLGDIKTVALFLFGSAYEQFWKTQPGSVVGVLNPSILDKRDGSRDEATLSVDNAQKLLILGQSKDLGICKSTKKNGDKCTAIVNKSDCEYCVYHIKKEYQKCSRRSELQANFSGKGLIALRNKVLGKNEVFYAGKSYTAIPAKQSRKMIKKDKDRLQSLSGMASTSNIKAKTTATKKSAASFDVDRGQRLKDIDTLRKLGVNIEKFENSPSNSNFQGKHSNEVTLNEAKANALRILSKAQNKSQEEDATKSEMEIRKEKSPNSSMKMKNEKSYSLDNKEWEDKRKKSSKIDDQYDLLQASLDEIVQTDFVDLDIDFRKSTVSKTNLPIDKVKNQKKQPLDVHEKKLQLNQTVIEKMSNPKTSNTLSSPSISSVKKKDYVEELTAADGSMSSNALQKSSSGSTPSQNISGPVFSKALLTSTLPSLSNNGGLVDLSKPLPKRVHKAKFNALNYIRKNGPLEKSDPNNIKGKGVKRSLDEINLGCGNAKKLQKIQENEFLSDRFKKMMELQSKHMDLVELRDNEEKEKYFKKQEVKEKMEEKMANTYKVECKAVRCLDCKYTNFSAGDKCRAEKHRLVYKNATKRFFKCGNCGNRIACLDIVPLYSCKNCGDGRWERTTMMKERNITNSVALSIRGGEQTFTNSVATDANINLLVCRQFNNICEGLLTKGFIQLEKKHTHIYKLAKSLLPRRPSERRSNALVSRYCEILQGMETRIRMLNVTYMRYIDQHLICFLPGKVLDEIKRLLRLIESRFDPPNNNNQLLEELRDLSSMAMEHFDEHILPLLEKNEQVTQYKNTTPSTSKSLEYSKTLKELRKLHKRNRLFKTLVSYLMSKTRRLSEKWNRQNLRMKKQSSIIKEQNAKLQVQATRLENHEMTISEMQKKFEELQSNFVEMKNKWEVDIIHKNTNISSTSDLSKKDTLIDTETISKNLRKIIHQESVRQKHDILKKICGRNVSDNRTMMNKSLLSNLQRNDARKKCMSMVDMEIWRRRCPTSRSTYSLWYKNNVRNKAEILLSKNQNSNESHPCSPEVDKNPKKTADFVYKSVIKQRASRIFPLTCLDLERKRKSHMCSDIPSKLMKNDANNSLKALDLINKYLPAPKQAKTPDDGDNSRSSVSYLEVHPSKRKREDSEYV